VCETVSSSGFSVAAWLHNTGAPGHRSANETAGGAVGSA
jgi:hypothetical protein